jgi:hypothetical protein
LKIKLDDDRREVLLSALGEEVKNYDPVFGVHRDRV